MTLRLLLFLLVALPLRAATVLLTVTGHVTETNSVAFFDPPIVQKGDAWTVTITYDFPRPPLPVGFEGAEIYAADRMVFEVNGLFWTGEVPYVTAVVAGPAQRVEFFTQQNVPVVIAPGGATSDTTIRWLGGTNLINDSSSLPDSFAKWNLPAATAFSLEVNSRLGPPGSELWHIRANSWETISIQVIPEPGAVCLMAVAALAVAGRRRRVRA